MNILTVENKAYDLTKQIPQENDDVRYCVLNCQDKTNIDFYFIPILFLEIFSAPAAVLEIGDIKIQMPLDWSVVVCDENYSSMEIIPLTSLNDRGFHTIAFNPLQHMFPTPVEVNIVNVYANVDWCFPKLRTGNILVVPIENKERPRCMLFVKEANKIPDFDISELF